MRKREKGKGAISCDYLVIVFVPALLLTAWPAQGATVLGTVIFQGAVPPAQEFRVTRDAEFCGEKQTIQLLHVHPNTGGVKDAVVSLRGIKQSTKDSPASEVILNNHKCMFVHHISTGMVHQMLTIRNDDPFLHNTNISNAKKTFINVALVKGGNPISKRFKRPGLLTVECNAHKFMQAYVLVFDHPYFSVTNETGQFKIVGIPAGTQRIEVWHEYLGTLETEVVVPKDGEVSVLFRFPSE